MRNILLLFVGLVALEANAQNKINSYKYWFDSGYSNAVSQSITPAQSYTLSAQINASALLTGMHLFNITFIDDSVRESSSISGFFYKTAPSTGTNNIATYQYWFDGNFVNAVTQAASGQPNFTLASDLSALNLLTGLHVLQVRFKDNNNLWSETLSYLFYKIDVTSGTNNIAAYQYWFDGNFVNAVTQAASGQPNFTLASDISALNLLTGLHLLQVRFKDNNNLWSETLSCLFYKIDVTSGTNNIKAFQYWFDQNFAGAVQQSITPVEAYTLSDPIDAVQLLTGIHTLQVRFLDNNNKWSSTISNIFYKTPNNDNNTLVQFQYWFDQNFAGAQTQAITPSTTYNLSGQLSSLDLLPGLHAISIRFSDSHQKWSSTTTQFFYKEKTDTTADNKLSGYRYWFDQTDSTLNLVTLAPFINTLIINGPVAADGMDIGQHVIHFQFRDTKGRWSMVTSDTATVVAHAIYTFNGNGNWSNPLNWVNNTKPPLNVSGTYNIFIDPAPGGQCILDVIQYITTGAIITVRSGKTFVIPGYLNLSQ